ncbi:MAG: transketolase C-terminal domain-containing protein [Gemmatales bacterium]
MPVDEDFLVPIGKADLKREGGDVTIISIAGALPACLGAADILAKEGIAADVVDLRTIVPMDKDAILKSVAKTGRVVIVDNSHRVGSVSSEVAAVISDKGFESLKKPVRRLTAPPIHVPFNAGLEKALFPTKDKVAEAVRGLV